jgi:hypothetical protein
MASEYCQFCCSYRATTLEDALYCERCEVYYTVINGKQRIKTLPLVETKQRSLSLCPRCTSRTKNNRKLLVKTFSEYFRGLPYCKSCKLLNKVFLKNLFFKSFLLYKKSRPVFGWGDLLILLALPGYISIQGNASVCLNRTLSLICLYVEYKRYSLTVLKSIVLMALFCQACEYEFMNFLYFTYCLCRIAFSSSIYFEVPINPYNIEELDNFIDKLSINTSFENDVYKYKRQANVRSNSHHDLKHRLL